MDAGYLTSGQMAQLLGIAKGTVLKAVRTGELRAAYKMPGGALRFMPADAERYARHLALKRELQAQRQGSRRASLGRQSGSLDTSRSETAPLRRSPSGAAPATVPSSPEGLAAGFEWLLSMTAGAAGTVAADSDALLTLVAESLQVGATCVARVTDHTWQIEQLHDRVGMGLLPAGPMPFGDLLNAALGAGSMSALVVEDARADARLSTDPAAQTWRVGAATAVPLRWPDGSTFGALCTFHPTARSVPSSEIPLLRLAGRLFMREVHVAAVLARERQVARQSLPLAAIVRYSDDAIIGKSLSGHIETWNDGATRLYGYSAEEAIGRHISLLVPADHADELPELLERLALGQHIEHYETVRRRKDGSTVDVSLTVSPILDDEGRVAGASTIARNITERVPARRDRERARLLAEELARMRQEQAEEADVMSAVSLALARTLDSSQVYQVIVQEARRLLPYDLANIILYEDGWAVIVASAGDQPMAIGRRSARLDRSEPYWLAPPDVPTYLPDTEQEPRWRDIPPHIGACRIRSHISLPFMLDGVQAGCFTVGSYSPNFYSEHQVRLAGAFGERAMHALRNARLHESERARVSAAEELIRVRAAAEAATRVQSTLLDAVGQAVIAADLSGNITYWNSAAERMYGWRATEVMGRRAVEVLVPQVSAEHAAQIVVNLARGEAWSGEFLVQRRDGSVFPALVTDMPILDAEGMMTGAIGVSVDITARRQVEDALRHSERQYRHIVETAQEGIWQLDSEDVTTFANRKMADMVGRTTEEMIGVPVSALLHEDERALAADNLALRRMGIAGQREVRLQRLDGSVLWAHLTVNPSLDEDGRYAGSLAMVTDITQRKKEERSLEQARATAVELARLRQRQTEEAQAMAAVSSALASTLEPSRLYQVVLEQAAKVLPCDHACVLLFQDGWATVEASWGALVQPHGMRTFPVSGMAPVTAFGFEHKPALVSDTSRIPWIDVPPFVGEHAIRSVLVVPLVVDDAVVGTFNVDSFTPEFYDEQHLALATALGERVIQALRNARLYALEQQRARAAEELARLQDDFVASVSHELRTPLTAIVGYAELLEARWPLFDDGRRIEYLRRLVLATKRQQRLVEDLLLLGSLERGVLEPRRERIELTGLLDQARDELRGSYYDQSVEVDGPHEVSVLADSDRAVQVIVNLMDNAAKYSPVGSPITARYSVEDGMAVVRIQDYGPGIPEHGRERLFTRFGRIIGSRTRAGHVGTGLGLYVSRRLANAMGGDLELEATGSEGSVFRLRLPI